MLTFDLQIDGGVGFSFNNRPSFSGIVKSAQANKQVNHISQTPLKSQTVHRKKLMANGGLSMPLLLEIL